MVRGLVVLAGVTAAALVWRAPAAGGPRYNGTGELLLPADVERWVAVGSSVGLGYSEGAAGSEDALFHSVLLEPGAYESYRRSGRFPDGTMLALIIRQPGRRTAPARAGSFAGERLAVELAVKDTARFAGGWAYFDFGRRPSGSAAPAQPRGRCQACHAEHAGHDNVFVQFYPVLREESRTR